MAICCLSETADICVLGLVSFCGVWTQSDSQGCETFSLVVLAFQGLPRQLLVFLPSYVLNLTSKCMLELAEPIS